MNIDLMRKLDYWAGVPLCFLLSAVDFFLKLIRPKTKRAKPSQKILFIKLAELGAIILSYPLLLRVKKEFPSARVFFLTFKKNKDVFAVLGGVIADRDVLTIRSDSPRMFIRDTLETIRRLRREKIEICFDLEFFSRFSSLLSYLVCPGKKIGFFNCTQPGLYRGNFLTHKAQYNPSLHVSKNYLSLSQYTQEESQISPSRKVEISGEEVTFPKYSPQPETQERMRQRLKAQGVNSGGRIFLLNPGEGVLPVREWPLENFIYLSRRILSDENNYLFMVGTEGARLKAEALRKAVDNSRCLNFNGLTSLVELLDLFYLAAALITNDCGLAHLAMLTPVRKFVLFGPESPQVFGAPGAESRLIYAAWPCSPCLSVLNNRLTVCRDNQCLKAIKPEYVYELIVSGQAA